jgi:menaquinone-9 beta-reductase
MKRIDVAVIGASLAGSTCARELMRYGIDVIAFERDRFPREKVCGGFLSPGAVDSLARLGVLDEIRRAGAVEVRSARLRMQDVEMVFEFPRTGLGISRSTLDAVLAADAPVRIGNVREVRRCDDGFRLRVDEEEFVARIVVDAAGKLSRFTSMHPADEFGVQFYESVPCANVLNFWFFHDGYGGAVSVEGSRSNACFLIRKEALPRYVSRPGCLVTGPISYRARSGDFISIGDAAGMIDPFCGEGMHHALDTGRLAASSVARGLAQGWPYDRIRRHYAAGRMHRWGRKRTLAAVVRTMVRHSVVRRVGVRFDRIITAFLTQLWS